MRRLTKKAGTGISETGFARDGSRNSIGNLSPDGTQTIEPSEAESDRGGLGSILQHQGLPQTVVMLEGKGGVQQQLNGVLLLVAKQAEEPQ